MANVVVCDDCVKTNTLVLAAIYEISIKVTQPDGTVRKIVGTVSACSVHGAPVDAVAAWLGQSTDEPPPASPKTPPSLPAKGDEYEFRCPECGDMVTLSDRSRHAQGRHSAKVAEIQWQPLFDVAAAGLCVCECGFIARPGRSFTGHLNDTGHHEDVGKAALKSDDFDTSTGKALLEAAQGK